MGSFDQNVGDTLEKRYHAYVTFTKYPPSPLEAKNNFSALWQKICGCQINFIDKIQDVALNLLLVSRVKIEKAHIAGG